MEVLRRTSAQGNQERNDNNCSDTGFSVSSVEDISVMPSTGWVDANQNGNTVTLSVSNNDDAWTSNPPPVTQDRGAVVTLVQEGSGNKLSIGVHQSGKGYNEKYFLVGDPSYNETVRASERFVKVTWTEEKRWQYDNDPNGDWNPFPDGKTETYEKYVDLGSLNKERHDVRISFSFVSANGVEVSGTVTQKENTCVTGITEFSGCTVEPDKIFWGCLDANLLPSFLPTNDEDDDIGNNSALKSPLTIAFTPIVTATWEVYNEDLPTRAAMSAMTDNYNRPLAYDPDSITDYTEFLKDLQQGYIFEDVSREPEYKPLDLVAGMESWGGVYVYTPYNYYPRYIQRDFECDVVFKEIDSNGNVVNPPDSKDSFAVNIHYATICDSDFSGDTKPSPTIFYQQTTTNISDWQDTGYTQDSPSTEIWPVSGSTTFTYHWKRRYFYAYPSGNNVEMKTNAAVYNSTTANTKVANVYFRIESDELTGSTKYDYDVAVKATLDPESATIEPENGTTKDSTKTEDLGTFDWYPCQMIIGEDYDETTRHITFIITRRPKR